MAEHTRRVESVLDEAILPGLSAAAFVRLSESRLPEDEQVEFKRQLYRGSKSVKASAEQLSDAKEAEKAEFAKDIVAMANGLGGVIFIGVGEGPAGQADALNPVSVADSEERWMRQVLSARCRPLPDVTFIKTPARAGSSDGFWALSVPRSPLAPHAIVEPNSVNLSFPTRRGTTTAFLSEPELADTYRSRFAAERSQVARLTEVLSEGWLELPAQGDPWVVVALVPSIRRIQPLDRRHSAETNAWLANLPVTILGAQSRSAWGARSVGVGRVTSRILGNDDKTWGSHADFYADGSTYMAFQLGGVDKAFETVEPVEPVRVSSLEIWGFALEAIQTAVDYACNLCLLSGDAVVAVGLADPALGAAGSTRGLVMDDGVSGYLHRPRPATREPWGRHTIDAGRAADDPTAMVQTARLAATEVFQGLGVAEVPFADTEGRLRLNAFASDFRQTVAQWAKAHGVAVVE